MKYSGVRIDLSFNLRAIAKKSFHVYPKFIGLIRQANFSRFIEQVQSLLLVSAIPYCGQVSSNETDYAEFKKQ
jgi:hypothetical protein